MSVKVSSWVWDHSQASGNDRLVALAIAEHAGHDGADAWPSQATLAQMCHVSEKTVQRAVNTMVELGELAVERQAGPAEVGRTNQRPNRYRFPAFQAWVKGGQPDWSSDSKGGQSDAPSRSEGWTSGHRRVDKSSQRVDTAVSDDPSFDPSDLDPSKSTPSSEPPAAPHDTDDESDHTLLDADLETQGGRDEAGSTQTEDKISTNGHGLRQTGTSRSSASRSSPQERRPDVEKLCKHLADRMVGNGCARPTITAKWRDAARLMLDRDGREFDKALVLLDWSQSDEFWRTNVHSMPTFRAQYDKIRLRALAEWEGKPKTNGYHSYRNPTDSSVYYEELRVR